MPVSRRGLIKGLGGLGALALAGTGLATIARKPSGGPAQAEEHSKAERQWAFVVDLRRCDGCKYCTEACQQTHYLSKDQEWIKV